MCDAWPVNDQDDAVMRLHVFVELRSALEHLGGQCTAAQHATADRAEAPQRRFAAQMDEAWSRMKGPTPRCPEATSMRPQCTVLVWQRQELSAVSSRPGALIATTFPWREGPWRGKCNPQGRDMQVLVDEGIGERSPLWQRFQAWLGHRRADIVWLKALYPAMPDVEILDKLLTPETVLLTQDRLLHNRALQQGARSLTLNATGQLTHTPLPLKARHLQAHAPSVVKTLKSTYQHAPHPLALKLSAERSPKVLKAQRTRRRRIRSYFGSMDNIAKVAWTIGARHDQGHVLCGYVVHIEGKQGVKGLRASEAYGMDPALAPDPAHALVHALCEVFHLHLEHVKHEFFVIPRDVLALAQQMTGPLPGTASPLHRALHQLWQALGHKQLAPCVTGRFYEQMQRKLAQLIRAESNEIVSLDFRDIVQRLQEGGE